MIPFAKALGRNFASRFFASLLAASVSTTALAAGGCNFRASDHLDELADIASIKRVEVEIKKYQKWTINGLSILTDRSENIKANRKKYFKADITVVYPFGNCVYDARVRQNGDWKDHIIYVDSSAIVQSLNVKMKEGNLSHFVRFKLLLPHTRQSENEIIFSSLLNQIGYLSPRSKMVSTKVNGVDYEMLLQESAAKEFLEVNYRREGPLFEGDEQLIWGWGGYDLFGLEPISLAKLVNSKWAAGGDSSISIAKTAFLKLQKAYMRFSNGEIGGVFIDWNLLTNGTEKAINNWAVYEILTLAAGGSHALRPTNRQFFWNAFEENFEPVYYDGNIALQYDMGYGSNDIEKYAGVLTPDHFSAAREKLKLINAEDFAAHMRELGVDKSDEDIRKILQTLISGVSTFEEHIGQFDNSSVKTDFAPSEANAYEERLGEMVPDAMIGTIQSMDFEAGTARVKLCKANTEKCGADAVEFADLAGFFGGDYFVNNNPAIITNSDNVDPAELRVETYDNGAIKLRATKSAEVSFDDQTRKLSIRQANAEDWALIYDSNLIDVDVELIGLDARPLDLGDGQRFNRFGLTGCVNFYDTTLEGVSISAINGTCEDSVNLVSSRGHLKDLSVFRSFADAIDIDFSSIEIDKVSVTEAGNDCLDVSSGNYKVGSVSLNQCGDKGISVGEASKFAGVNVLMDGGAIGISSKDSSHTQIKTMAAINTKLCAEAFKKKQEFFGGKLDFDKFECEADSFSADENSQITVGGTVQ